MATGDDDDVPGDVLKLLGEDGPKIVTQLINNMHKTGQELKDFTEVTIIQLQVPKAKKCSDHHTYSKDSSKDTKGCVTSRHFSGGN